MNIGSQYENVFRKLMKDKYPVIIRVPDYKATGTMAVSPCDFLCVKNGITDYYEVKHSYNKNSFPLKNIKDSQIRILRSIYHSGKVLGVYVFIFMNRKKYRVPILPILNFIYNEKRKSLPISWLEKYGY